MLENSTLCVTVCYKNFFYAVIHNRDVVEPRYNEAVKISTIAFKLYYIALP